MRARTSKSFFFGFFLCCVFAVTSLASRSARAEESIIKRPGDHPTYGVELEPHLLAAFFYRYAGDGFGLGGRATIPIVKNGFVSSINNSVGIGFGLDWIHWGGCYRYWAGPGFDCPSVNSFVFP